MNDKDNPKDKSDHEAKFQFKYIPKKKKKRKLGRMITYIVNIVFSWFLGAATTLSMGSVYPYFTLFFVPAGSFTYILTQIYIGKGFLKRDKSKTSILLFIFSILGTLASFIFGLYYRLSKIERFVGTAMYSVFSKKRE